MSSISSKRPSFSWIAYRSPRKGFMTIFVLVGSFCASWLPISAHAIVCAFSNTYLERYRLLLAAANCLFVASFATHPILYGLLNRAIRKEMKPAFFPPKNLALQGLPRKNSSRRISDQGE